MLSAHLRPYIPSVYAVKYDIFYPSILHSTQLEEFSYVVKKDTMLLLPDGALVVWKWDVDNDSDNQRSDEDENEFRKHGR